MEQTVVKQYDVSVIRADSKETATEPEEEGTEELAKHLEE